MNKECFKNFYIQAFCGAINFASFAFVPLLHAAWILYMEQTDRRKQKFTKTEISWWQQKHGTREKCLYDIARNLTSKLQEEGTGSVYRFKLYLAVVPIW